MVVKMLMVVFMGVTAWSSTMKTEAVHSSKALISTYKFCVTTQKTNAGCLLAGCLVWKVFNDAHISYTCCLVKVKLSHYLPCRR
jgi:hypothetical protein